MRFLKRHCTLLVLRRLLLLSIALFECGCLVLYVKIILDSDKVEDDFLALACLVIQIPASAMIIIFTILDITMTTKCGRIKCNWGKHCDSKYCCTCFKERFCDDNKPKDAANSACLCKCISCANGPAIGMLICFLLISKHRKEIIYIAVAVIAKLVSVLGMALQYSVQRLIRRDKEKYSLFGEDQGLTKTVQIDAENINWTIAPNEQNINHEEDESHNDDTTPREELGINNTLTAREELGIDNLAMDTVAMENVVTEPNQEPKISIIT